MLLDIALSHMGFANFIIGNGIVNYFILVIENDNGFFDVIC